MPDKKPPPVRGLRRRRSARAQALRLGPQSLEFGQVVGLYIATLFVVWQVINLLAFRSWPTIPIGVGGALIVAGGLLVSFWNVSG